jgi:hypothetical protein
MLDEQISPDYLREVFRPEDRIALVLIDRRSPDRNRVDTRIVTAGKAAGGPYQAWLRHKNAEHYDIYAGLNPVHAEATGRTKSDIAEVRHLYLDFDGARGLPPIHALLARPDIPNPHIIVNTSPGNHQVIWRAKDFEKPEAEALLRGLSREARADIAATDVSRVLRLPGFFNWKREEPHFVSVVDRPSQADAVRPQDFPVVIFDRGRDVASTALPHGLERLPSGKNSRSEIDWRNVLHRLERGDSRQAIERDLAQARSDKPNPSYYAKHTVERAVHVWNANEHVKQIAHFPHPAEQNRRSR